MSVGILLGIMIGAAVYGRGFIRKGRGFGVNTGGFFQVGEKDGLLGLNGGGNGGKVD